MSREGFPARPPLGLGDKSPARWAQKYLQWDRSGWPWEVMKASLPLLRSSAPASKQETIEVLLDELQEQDIQHDLQRSSTGHITHLFPL